MKRFLTIIGIFGIIMMASFVAGQIEDNTEEIPSQSITHDDDSLPK
jgi:hypothetical protein